MLTVHHAPLPCLQGAAAARPPEDTTFAWRNTAFQVVLEVAWPTAQPVPEAALASLADVEQRMALDLPEALTSGCERPLVCWEPRQRACHFACAASQGRQAASAPDTLPSIPCPDVNYLDVTLDRWQALARYAGANAGRLVAVKRRHDPHDLFSTPWSVPPTLEPPTERGPAREDAGRELRQA